MQHSISQSKIGSTKTTSVGKIKTLLLYIYLVLTFYEGYLNQILGPLTKYYLFIIMLVFLSGYKMIKIEGYHIFILSWLFFKVGSIYWVPYNSVGSNTVSTHLLSQVGMVGFFLVMTVSRFDCEFVKKIINMSMYISASMGVLSLFFSEAYFFEVESRQVLTLFGHQIDPNNLAALYLVGFAIALYNFVFEKKCFIRNSIIIGINGFALSLTASRGGLLSLMAIVICVFVLSNKQETRMTDFVKKFCFLMIMIVILYLIMKLFLPGNSFERLFEFNSYEGGSERDVLWASAIELFKQRPLLGWGWGGYPSGVHNTYLSMLCDIGVVGTALFLTPIITVCLKTIKTKKPLAIILLICGFAPAFFIDAINKRFFWNALILAVMILNCNKIQNQNIRA